MSVGRKTLRLAVPCFALIGIALALAIGQWPKHAKIEAMSSRSSLPTLQGTAAVEHLRQAGLYDSLAAVMTATRYGAKAVPSEQNNAPGNRFVTNNPGQQLRAEFAPEGVKLSPTVQSVGWRLGLQLRSAGYGDEQCALGPGRLTAQDNRVEYEHSSQSAIHNSQSAIKEWYVNAPTGVEQGFTLAEPLPHRRAGEPLRLTLALTSELRARTEADRQAVEFVDAAGNRVLRYDHLAAWDACGQTLAARMSVAGDELRLEVDDAAATYPVTIDPNFTQQAYLKASNTGANDQFGFSVAVSGDTVVVGAYWEDSNATGVNGNQADNSASTSGAAYVFVRSGTTWSQQAYLKASNTGADDNFGHSVAVSGDTTVIGAYQEDSSTSGVNGNQADNSASEAGAVYVFFTPPLVVTTLADEQNTNGQCSLREALINANNNDQSGSTDCAAGSGADTITFSVNGTINLTGALPDISQSLTITGPGANLLTVRRNTAALYRIFTINVGVTASLSGLTIANGDVGSGDTGGGVRNSGTLTITNCAVTGNHANGAGGVENLGTLTMTGSTISGNSANFDGGGFYNIGNATATLTNCTISGNSGGGGFSSGLINVGFNGDTALVTMTNCTVTANTGGSDAVRSFNFGGATVTTQIKNTLVAANSADNFNVSVNTTLTSLGNNLDSDGTSGFTNGVGGNIVGTADSPINALLAPLGNYGGPTQTHALLGNSPAINTGNNTGAPTTDQRGVRRPQSGTVDIGAVEVGLQFYPLPAPVRLLETRPGFSGCTNPGAAIPANGTLPLAARTGCSGVPTNAVAITGNVTVVPSSPGYITLFPSDATQPIVANSNFNTGEITNNVFTTGLGAADGALKIFASATTHVIMDVTGYYAPDSPSGLYFHPLPSPVRLVETRTGLPVGCIKPGAKLIGTGNPNANPNLDFVVQGRTPVASPCNVIPATAQVLVGNATTVFPSGGGYLTIYPSDAARPTVASSNYAGADVINGPFAVRLGADGKFKVYTFATTDLVIDILGYYSPDAVDANGPGQYFNQIPHPVRLLETRTNPPSLPGCIKPGTRLESQTFLYNIKATDTCEAIGFSAARAIVGNATVVTPDNAGYMTFAPFGQPLPTVATSNFVAGGAYNRHFFVGLDAAEGKFNIFFNMNNPTGTVFKTDLVIDVSGYFAP